MDSILVNRKLAMIISALVLLWSIDFTLSFSTKAQFEAGLGNGIINQDIYTEYEFKQMKLKRARSLKNRHNLRLYYNGILATVRRQENRNYMRNELTKSKLAFKKFGQDPCMPMFRKMKIDRRSRMNRQPESNRIEKKMNESIILLEDLIYVKPSLNGTFSMSINSMMEKRYLKSKMATLREKPVRFLKYVPFEEFLRISGNYQRVQNIRYSMYIEYYIEYMYRQLHYLEYYLTLNMHMNQFLEMDITSEYKHFKDGIRGFRNIVCVAYYYADYIWRSRKVNVVPKWIRNTDSKAVKEATYLVLYHANRTIELMSKDLRQVLSKAPSNHRRETLPSDDEWKVHYNRDQVKRSSLNVSPQKRMSPQLPQDESESPIENDLYDSDLIQNGDNEVDDMDYQTLNNIQDTDDLVDNASTDFQNTAADNPIVDGFTTGNQFSSDNLPEENAILDYIYEDIAKKKATDGGLKSGLGSDIFGTQNKHNSKVLLKNTNHVVRDGVLNNNDYSSNDIDRDNGVEFLKLPKYTRSRIERRSHNEQGIDNKLQTLYSNMKKQTPT